jgi:hypothetical protein
LTIILFGIIENVFAPFTYLCDSTVIMSKINRTEADTFSEHVLQEATYGEAADYGLEDSGVWEPFAEPTDFSPANPDRYIEPLQSEKKSTKTGISPHLLEAAGKAIDTLIVISGRETVSSGKVMHIAFGDRQLPRSERRGFLKAVNQDPRVQYKGKGRYLILERTIPTDRTE